VDDRGHDRVVLQSVRPGICVAGIVGGDAVLAEIDAASCERLLNNRTPLALKLLAALNQGLVAALRAADRQLMRLTEERPDEGGESAITAEPVVPAPPVED